MTFSQIREGKKMEDYGHEWRIARYPTVQMTPTDKFMSFKFLLSYE